MRFIFILAFIACLIAVATSAHCPLGCKRNYKPVCGKKLVKGYWKKKTFSNDCEMRNENECYGGEYIPCSEDYED
ncbi:unnamed protein product [Nezara viridula]|uniref:Neuropeptide n=1 Tax=Nezara viridula TaxID=85310 RepID=A0A9P0MWL3_NEZVI|nr:unnamed protein product [Nezara viridula]